MDRQIFRILRKICLFLFTGNIFAHAVVGASAINGVIKGGISMVIMLVLIIVLTKLDRNNEVRKNQKKRHKKERGVSPEF